jgi:ketosteroid isomerase-like protein
MVAVPVLATGLARSDTHTDEIETVLRGLEVDWNAGDISAYLAAYARNEDLRMLSTAGIIEGWEELDAEYRKHFPDELRMGDFKIISLDVRLLTEDVAIASGTFEHVFVNETIRGPFSHVLRRQPDGSWRIELEHVSRSEVVRTGD